jgi:ribonucleoside-diphosphate reductase alpha chain
MATTVLHRDGSVENFQTEKIIEAISSVLKNIPWLNDPFVAMFKIIKNFETKLPEQVKTEEIDNLLLKAIEPLIAEDPLYDAIATKQYVKIISENVNKRFSSFAEYVHYAVDNGFLDPRMKEFNLGILELEMNYENDNFLNYFWLSTLNHRYLIKDYDKNVLEKPQWMWMRIAMWLSLNEANKEEFTLKVYHKLASLKYLHSTPTLFNSGTNHPQLISCFIWVVDDSLDSIMDKAKEMAFYAKHAWWTAMSVTKLRASGSVVKSINSASSGPIPFIKIYDTTIASVAIWGKRASNIVVYMEPWHLEIEDYLDLKETNGNEAARARKLNTALWIPDEFMRRVEMDMDRYLFDPHEFQNLSETWGDAFVREYEIAIQKAESGQAKKWKKMRAQELYREMLIRAAKTWNYWLNFKDRHNEKNQAPNYAPIHSTNMCTEISIANRPDSTATCTLASINLSRFVMKEKISDDMTFDQKNDAINWKDLKETVQIAVRALDNVVDLNYYVSEPSKKWSFDLRPLGLGIMGLGELFLKLNIPYESTDAVKISDILGKYIYDAAYDISVDLAKERWTFADYSAENYPYEPRRNILLLAIAPTATISNIAWTSSWVETYFSNVYARETVSGKFTIIVGTLVEKLKEKGLWTEEIRQQILANQGSVQHIDALDWMINKQVFKTVYECSPASQVDVAAAWQKHVDQAISRNLYVQEHERNNLFDIYMYAWKKWLKSTYYCFIEKNIQWEKYTESVNKRGGRVWFGGPTTPTEGTTPPARWFGFAAAVTATAQTTNSENNENSYRSFDAKNITPEQKAIMEQQMRAEKWDEYVEKLKAGTLYGDSCPVDPFEKVMCEGCQ